MYKDEYHPQVKRDVEKLLSQLRESIKETHLPARKHCDDFDDWETR